MLTRRLTLGGIGGLALTVGTTQTARAGEYIRIPITVNKIGRALMPVHINGQGPYSFIIDTGASSSGILTSLAQTLKLPFAVGRNRGGLGGDDIESVYRAKRIVYGDTFHQDNVVFGGVRHLDQDGFLAAGCLTTLPSELDYGLSEVRLFIRGSPNMSGYYPINSSFFGEDADDSPKIFCQAVIDGIPLKLLVDTGAPVNALLYPSTVKAHGLWDKYTDAKASRAAGVTGAVTATRDVVMPNFALSDVTVPNLPVVLMDPAGYNDNEGDGVLGSQFLKLFSVAIVNNSMALRLNAPPAATPPAP